MRIVYVLLSPAFGMHQYTADLCNRMARAGDDGGLAKLVDVHLVTTASDFLNDRYASEITVHTLGKSSSTGFSSSSLNLRSMSDMLRALLDLSPDLIHFTGPHIWNLYLMRALSTRGIPVVQTLHSLDPHHGARFGPFLRLWNQRVMRSANHILVHGQIYRERLLAMGIPRERVTYTPLLNLILGDGDGKTHKNSADDVEYQPWALLFGLLERDKGLGDLLAACDMLGDPGTGLPRAMIAGLGNVSDLWAGNLPKGVELRNRVIPDAEAVDLFRRCGLVVLPYINATPLALIASAYYFRKPVLVTRTGALPEYVEDGQTGRVVEPGHPATLARCLAEMLGDPGALARMGAEGRAWYDSRRAVEGQTLVAMYRRVASARPGKTTPRDR